MASLIFVTAAIDYKTKFTYILFNGFGDQIARNYYSQDEKAPKLCNTVVPVSHSPNVSRH